MLQFAVRTSVLPVRAAWRLRGQTDGVKFVTPVKDIPNNEYVEKIQE